MRAVCMLLSQKVRFCLSAVYMCAVCICVYKGPSFSAFSSRIKCACMCMYVFVPCSFHNKNAFAHRWCSDGTDSKTCFSHDRCCSRVAHPHCKLASQVSHRSLICMSSRTRTHARTGIHAVLLHSNTRAHTLTHTHSFIHQYIDLYPSINVQIIITTVYYRSVRPAEAREQGARGGPARGQVRTAGVAPRVLCGRRHQQGSWPGNFMLLFLLFYGCRW